MRNDNCGAIRTRAQAQEADIESAMRDLEPGMNVAFKYEGTGNCAIGRVVSKPRVLTSRTRTDTAWLRSGDKVVDVEMYNDEQHRDGESILTLGIDRCGHLYCDCGPEANCDLQHVETKEVHHIITYGFKLATPRRSRRQVCTSQGELQYYMTPLASQQIKNSMAKYAAFQL